MPRKTASNSRSEFRVTSRPSADVRAQLDATDAGDERHLDLCEIVDHLVGGDAVLVEAAGLAALVHDNDLVAVPGKGMGAGETCGARTDHSDPPAGGRCPRERLQSPIEEPVGGVALEHADPHRLALLRLTHAGPLAQDLGGADPGTGPAHDVGPQDRRGRTLDVVGLDAADEARDVDARRASLEAGRIVAEIAAAGLDQCMPAIERRVQVGVEIAGVFSGTESPGADVDAFVQGSTSRQEQMRPQSRFLVDCESCKKLTRRSRTIPMGARGLSRREPGQGQKGRIAATNRARILAAAEEVFAREGFKGATTAAIAAAAGLPKANVHYYFATKEAIYRAVIGRILELWLDAFGAIGPADDPATALGDYIRRKMRPRLRAAPGLTHLCPGGDRRRSGRARLPRRRAQGVG